MDRIFLCSTFDLKINDSLPFDTPGGSIVLFRTKSGFYAVKNRCPHAGAPLHEGLINGDILTCIWHGWKFNLKTSKCLSRANATLTHIPILIKDQKIYLRMTF